MRDDRVLGSLITGDRTVTRITTDVGDGDEVLEDLGELHEVGSGTGRDGACEQARIGVLDHRLACAKTVHELPGTGAAEGLFVVGRIEVHQLAVVHAEVGDDTAVVAFLQGDILQPLVEVDLHLDVHHTRLHGGAEWVGDRTVGAEVAGSRDDAAFVQLVLAGHAIEDQLVGSSLHTLVGRVELIQEQHPTLVGRCIVATRQRITFQREEIGERGKPCTTILAEAGQARQIFRSTGAQTVIDQLQVELAGHAAHDRRLAHAGTRLDEGDETGIAAVFDERTDLTGRAAIKVVRH